MSNNSSIPPSSGGYVPNRTSPRSYTNNTLGDTSAPLFSSQPLTGVFTTPPFVAPPSNGSNTYNSNNTNKQSTSSLSSNNGGFKTSFGSTIPTTTINSGTTSFGPSSNKNKTPFAGTNNTTNNTNKGFSSSNIIIKSSSPTIGTSVISSSNNTNNTNVCNTGGIDVEVYLVKVGYRPLASVFLKKEGKVCGTYVKCLDPLGNIVYVSVSELPNNFSVTCLLEGDQVQIDSVPYDNIEEMVKTATPETRGLAISCDDDFCFIVDNVREDYRTNNTNNSSNVTSSAATIGKQSITINDTRKSSPVVSINDIINNERDVVINTNIVTNRIINRTYHDMNVVLRDTDDLYRRFTFAARDVYTRLDETGAVLKLTMDEIKDRLSSNGLSKDERNRLLDEMLVLNDKLHEFTKSYKVVDSIKLTLYDVAVKMEELNAYTKAIL